MDCVDPNCAPIEVCLNASAPFEPDTLFLSVITSLLQNSVILKVLVDSGSTHCVVDSQFVSKHKLITYPVTLIPLHLFNGTSNQTITQAIYIPLQISLGHVTPFTFHVIKLNPSCSVVWPTHHNLFIDWVLSSITVRNMVINHPDYLSPFTLTFYSIIKSIFIISRQ
jgi:Retroviral aspartyl protease